MTDERNDLFPENENQQPQEDQPTYRPPVQEEPAGGAAQRPQNEEQPSQGGFGGANQGEWQNPPAGWQTPSSGWQNASGNSRGGGFYPPSTPPQGPKKPWFTWVVALGALYLVLILGILAMISTGALRFGDEAVDGEVTAETSETLKTEDEKEGETETREPNAPIKENTDTDGGNTIVGEDYTGEALAASELYETNVECVVFVAANYQRGQATGSGFVIDSENGYILTNYHVVEESQDIAVTFHNGDSYTAELIGGDEINDVAVLKVEAKDLKHVTIGDSDKLRVGEDVLIIGNPLGDLTFTMTKGIVSGVDRTINTGEHNIKTFQTDTAINSGNSGGPAFDATGAVIGIASAKYSSTGVEGIGFCIPINDAMVIARDLVEHGYVTGRPNFGIAVSDSLGYEYATDEYGRRVLVETTKGARVEEVGKESCAGKAGLQVGDIVTKLGEKKIENANQLINAKNTYKAGDTVTMEVYRKGETITLEITLDEYTPD